MTMKTGTRQALWMAAGAAVFLGVLLVVLRFHDDRGRAERLAAKAARADRVARMQLALTSASEAEKSAVLAVSDEDSKTFADKARAAADEVERARVELEDLLRTGASREEADLVAQFATAFVEYRRIDAELLDLAVKNTNLKASALTYGPAADALAQTTAALARIASGSDAKTTTFAMDAEIAALRIQTLLPPHVAEESDVKMDELESRMAKDDAAVRADLADLAATPRLAGDADLAAATAGYARYAAIRADVLKLSRENTNVRSLSLSLNQKRKATKACAASLDALARAIQDEPPGPRAPSSPR